MPIAAFSIKGKTKDWSVLSEVPQEQIEAMWDDGVEVGVLTDTFLVSGAGMALLAGDGPAGDTIRALNLPFAQAVKFFRGKINMPTSRWQDNYGKSNARAFSVAGAMSDALISDFRGEIEKALTEGTTLADFRKSFDDIVTRHGWEHVGSPGWRARIIYQTNLSTAYSAGRYAQMTEPETLDAFPYWEYVHSGAEDPRPEHLAWDGMVLPADDPWWDAHYPPNGWVCGCRVRVLSQRGLRKRGKTSPDKAPVVKTAPYKDPETGEIRQVPEGIDPGFEYNPGKVWKNGS